MFLLRSVRALSRPAQVSIAGLVKKVNFPINRTFTVTSTQFYKKYQDVENEFNYNIIKDKIKQDVDQNITDIVSENFDFDKVVEQKDFSGKSNAEILREFSGVAKFCSQNNICITEDRLTEITRAVIRIAPNISDQQLSKLLLDLNVFPEAPSITSKNFFHLWQCLDDICTDRITKWNFDQLLYFAHHWYLLNLSKKGSYTSSAIYKMSRKFKKLNLRNLVELMFYLNLSRKATASMFDIEVRFNHYFDELSIDEIGVICIGFFKTETRIHNSKLLEKIYRRTIDSIDDIKGITLVNILKVSFR